MAELLEIRWHGRGGQGAKTVALLFGEAALATGKYIQAFPEYGPERMGAPVQSFNRLCDDRITRHCQVTAPKIVVVLDETLIGQVNVVEGLQEDGSIIVNTTSSPKEMKDKLGLKSQKVYTVDASKIAIECIKLNKPNTPMMGALIKVSAFLEIDGVIKDTEKKLKKKFAHKPEVIDGNLDSIKRAYGEVKGE